MLVWYQYTLPVARSVLRRIPVTQDAEIVEDFDISGLLVHHVDAVLASVVYAEADVEVVVLVDGDSRFGLLTRNTTRSATVVPSGMVSALHAAGDVETLVWMM